MSVLSKFAREDLDDDFFKYGLSDRIEAGAKANRLNGEKALAKMKGEHKMPTKYNNSRLQRGDENGYYPTPQEQIHAAYMRGEYEPRMAEMNMEDSGQGFYYDPMIEQGTLMERFQQGLGNVSSDAYHGIRNGMEYLRPYGEAAQRAAGYIVKPLTIPYAYASKSIEDQYRR